MDSGRLRFVYDHEKFTPATMLEMIQKYASLHFVRLPPFSGFWFGGKYSSFYDLSSLEYCTIAGGSFESGGLWSFLNLGYKITRRLRTKWNHFECAYASLDWTKTRIDGFTQSTLRCRFIYLDGRSAEAGEQGQIVIRTDRHYPKGFSKVIIECPADMAKHGTTIFTIQVMWHGATRIAISGL